MRNKGGAYPHIEPTGVWDVVVNVTVVTQTHDAKANQGTHVQGEDWDEQRLHTLQVAVEENGHENNLRETTEMMNNQQSQIQNSTNVLLVLLLLPELQHQRSKPSPL